MGWLKKHLSSTLVEGPDGNGLTRLQQHVGQIRPAWDQSGIPGTVANDPEQPQALELTDVRLIDPTWRPM